MIISPLIVAAMLLTKWDGHTTIFGNQKWGRATDHYAFPTNGKYWREFNWLVLRNPVNNLLTYNLAFTDGPHLGEIKGNPNISDKTFGGFYKAKWGCAWEYYLVKPYDFFGRRCLRIRIGWKLVNADKPAAFVFVINPWKKYSGL